MFSWLSMPACRDPSSCNDLPIPNNAGAATSRTPCQKIVFGGSIWHRTSKHFVFWWCTFLFATFPGMTLKQLSCLYILPKHRLVLCKFQGSLNISWSVAASFQNKTCTFISMHHICWCCSTNTNIWMCWRQNIVLNTSKQCAFVKKNHHKTPSWDSSGTRLNRFEPLWTVDL
jgi:hypothetical protein